MVVAAIERCVQGLGLPGRRILVACSGGVDSTVLLCGLHGIADRCRLELAVGHVDHGLRGSESEADRDAVEALAGRLGLPFECEGVAPATLREDRSKRERPTLQEAARTLRYQALDRMAVSRGCHVTATGHNLDDQAETVLMRVFRGSSPAGLGGIPERSADGRVVRPLLSVSREEIESWALEHGISWREDSSNVSDDYTRNRLRRHWIPLLAKEFNPQLLRALGHLAEVQRRESEWIESLVDDAARRLMSIEEERVQLVPAQWRDLPDALARRLARRAMLSLGAGRDVTRTHLERIIDFVRSPADARSGASIELPGGLTLTRDSPGRATLARSRV